MKNIIFDINVILDMHSPKRNELFPESKEVFNLALENPNINLFLSSSSLDNIAFLKSQQLKVDFSELSKKQCRLSAGEFVRELLTKFKIAKTPAYLPLDIEDIEDSQIIGSALAINAQVVTRDLGMIEKHPDIAISPQKLITLFNQPKDQEVQFIDLKKQYTQLQSKIEKQIDEVLNSASFIMGNKVKELEEQLADYVGVKHAITCANGTDALQLSLMALGIGPGDAVLTTTFTFFATAEVISLVGSTPVFVDVDESTFNIDPKKLEEAIQNFRPSNGEKLKAVIAVDLFGLSADYSQIEPICQKYNLKLIEDAAQGFGGSINGKRAGSFGDIATTSFFPAKPLGCYGDGGAVFTDNDDYAELVRSFRVHGKGQDKYDNVRIGLNSRLDTIQAAILLEKLANFDTELDARNNVASAYSQGLRNHYNVPALPEGYISSWAQYTLISDERDQCMAALKKKGIPSAIYYGRCMHQQTAFVDLAHKEGDFKVAERLSRQIFSLPMHPNMSADQIDTVTQALTTL